MMDPLEDLREKSWRSRKKYLTGINLWNCLTSSGNPTWSQLPCHTDCVTEIEPKWQKNHTVRVTEQNIHIILFSSRPPRDGFPRYILYCCSFARSTIPSWFHLSP